MRSLSTIARLLARHGISVRALATTATEGSRNIDVQRELAEAGIFSSVQKGRTGRRNRPELTYDDHGVPHRLLDVAHRKAFAWEETLGREFDLMFDEELASFKPDVMLTFGGTSAFATTATWTLIPSSGRASTKSSPPAAFSLTSTTLASTSKALRFLRLLTSAM